MMNINAGIRNDLQNKTGDIFRLPKLMRAQVTAIHESEIDANLFWIIELLNMKECGTRCGTRRTHLRLR